MSAIVAQVSRLLALLTLPLLLPAAGPDTRSPLLVYDFTLAMTPAQNVDHVKALGFDGLVTRVREPADLQKLDAYAHHVATLDDFRLLAYVVHDFTDPWSPDLWRAALPTLAQAGAPLWVVVRKAPSQLALRQLLAQMAGESQALGVRTIVYPHWSTSIETAAEAAAVIAEVGHPNLKNSLHSCHEIRGGNQYEMEAVVAEHAAQTALVTIAGADEDAYAGPPSLLVDWDDVIKPLDEGDYSLLPFLQALHDEGYDGPVILQTFGIANEPDHLERSLRTYAGYVGDIVRAGPGR